MVGSAGLVGAVVAAAVVGVAVVPQADNSMDAIRIRANRVKTLLDIESLL